MITKDKNIVDVIIVSYGNPEMTINCVDSLRSTTSASLNIIIVDNASIDDTVVRLKEGLNDVQIVVNDSNLGYAQAVNIGAERCTSEFILISNNDVIYKDGVVDGLLNDMRNENGIGVIGPAQEYADGSWQISHGEVPGINLALKHIFLIEGLSNVVRKINRKYLRFNFGLVDTGYIDGAVMLVRRDVFEKANGFDRAFTFYSEETDFCFRVNKLGYRIVSNSKLIVTHLRGGANNFGNLKFENISKLVESKVQFCKKHYSERQTFAYIMIEHIYSYIFVLLLSFGKKIVGGELKERITEKAKVMNYFSESWSKVRKQS